MYIRNFAPSLFLGAFAIALLLPGPSVAESKLKCETVKGYKCDARADGSLYNCRNVTTEKCTVVSGPGSGKTKPATVVQSPKTPSTKVKVPVTTQPLTATPSTR